MADGLRFKDKVAIVTGGCGGVGRGCVDVFVENGGKVAIFDLDDKTGSTLPTDGPGEMFYIKCDATDEESVKSAIQTTVEKYGRIDCLVNNVGTHPGSNDIDNISVDDFRKLVDINLVSHFIASKYALPHIRKVKGSVVSIASFSGTYGQVNCPSYCTTKCAVSGLTRAMALDEGKHGVRVNSIAPGPIDTDLYRQWRDSISKEEADGISKWNILQRIGQPKEVGKACLYLAVDATYTTGEELMVTGGCEIGYGLKLL